MRIMTRDFGEIDIENEEIIEFAGPIYGFDSYKQYAFLYQADISEHFVWLQSVEDPALCFILMEPELVVPGYRPRIPASAEELLGPGDCMCWLVVVIKENFKESTVNLKSPIVVNPATKRAAQIILEEDLPIHHLLMQTKEGE